MNRLKKRNWNFSIKNVISGQTAYSDTLENMTFHQASTMASTIQNSRKLHGDAYRIELKPSAEEVQLEQIYVSSVCELEKTLRDLRGKYQDSYSGLRITYIHDPDGGCQATGFTQYFLVGTPIEQPDRAVEVILEDLRDNLDKGLKLVSDPQPGLMAWNMLFKERLQKIANNLAEFGIAAE